MSFDTFIEAAWNDHGDQPRQSAPSGEKGGVQAHSGSYAVCVRTCDGSFFPVSYSGAGSRADSLEDVCRALCPNADMALYSFPFGGTVDEAASPTGEPYATPPNSRRLTIQAAPAGARGKRGLKRSPTRKRGMATRSTTFW